MKDNCLNYPDNCEIIVIYINVSSFKGFPHVVFDKVSLMLRDAKSPQADPDRLIGGSQWGCSKHGTRLKISRFHGARLIFTSNNCSELRKSYKQHGYLDKIIHDTRLIYSLFHDTRQIFWTFHATILTPLRPSDRPTGWLSFLSIGPLCGRSRDQNSYRTNTHGL